MFARASRLTCQQSSMLTYTYPASFIPDFTTASAMSLIMSSLTLQANLFHEFQPMGGVRARFADGDVLCCATTPVTKSSMQKDMVGRARLVFMQTFYQKFREISKRRDLIIRVCSALSKFSEELQMSTLLWKSGPFRAALAVSNQCGLQPVKPPSLHHAISARAKSPHNLRPLDLQCPFVPILTCVTTTEDPSCVVFTP